MHNDMRNFIRFISFFIGFGVITLSTISVPAEEVVIGKTNTFEHQYCDDLYMLDDVYWCRAISLIFNTEPDDISGAFFYEGIVDQNVSYYDANTDEVLLTIPDRYVIERHFEKVGTNADGTTDYRINEMAIGDYGGIIELAGKCLLHDLVWHIHIRQHPGAPNKASLFHSSTPLISSDLLCD